MTKTENKIRAIMAIFGMDQHETGAKFVSYLWKQAGIEVIYLGRFQLPQTIVTSLMQEDVDIVGISCHSWEYIEYVTELLDLLKKHKLYIPVVLGGGVITEGDESKLRQLGVAAVFRGQNTPEDIIKGTLKVAKGK